MERRFTLDGEMQMERRPGYMWVWHRRSARTVDEASAVLEAMGSAMEEWALDRLLFDSRHADPTPPQVGAAIWEWLAGNPRLRRVATLVESPERAERINTGMVGVEVRIRAFHDETMAVRWLTMLR